MDFAENNDEFYIFSLVHCKMAALITGIGGALIVIVLSVLGLSFFQWKYYDPSVDVIAMMGFCIFLISGTVIHLLVIYGIRCNRTRYLSPFSAYHLFLIALNTITSLIAVGEIVSDQKTVRENSSDHARIMLFTLPVTTLVQIAMMYSVSRCKSYLRKRARWMRMGRRPRVREVLETPSSHSTSSIFTTKTSITPLFTPKTSQSSENLLRSDRTDRPHQSDRPSSPATPGPSHK